MWGDWATRCLAYKDSRTPFKTLMAYFLMGSVVGFGTLNQPKPKYMTNPQTAQDFTRRCEAHIQKTAWQQAFKDCNKAISLNDAPQSAYFGLVLFVAIILKTITALRLISLKGSA